MNNENHLDRQIVLYLKAIAIVFVCVIVLVACGHSGEQKELDRYMAQVKAKPPMPVPPLPVMRASIPVVYNGENYRNPFIAPLMATTKPKQPLEAFPLDSLKMVGVLNENQKVWALIQAPDGIVYRATLGDHMGQNQGSITNISPQALELEERIPDSAGWHNKKTIIKLWSATGS